MNLSAKDSEQAIIGCVLMENSLIYQCLEFLSDDDFKGPINKLVFKQLKKLILDEKHSKVDPVVLKEACKNFSDKLGNTYFMDCLDFVYSTEALSTFIKAVKENSTKLSLLTYFNASLSQVEMVNGNFREWLNNVESQFKTIIEAYRKQDLKKAYTPGIYTEEARALYKSYKDNPEIVRGLRTGFEQFDKITKGLKILNVLTATTGAGKTALAMNMAVNISMLQGIPVLYLNYEMEKDDLIRRAVSSLSEVESDRILFGRYNKGEWERVNEILDMIKDIGTLHVTDNKPKDINSTRSLIYSFKNKHDIKVVFVDYIGEIEPDSLAIKEHAEYLTYGRYAQTLKDICSELDLKCVLLTQFGRFGEESPQRRHIQGSWKIVQKSDIMMILYYDKDNDTYKLKIDKQRHGFYPFEISLRFRKQIHKFEEIKAIPEECPF